VFEEREARNVYPPSETITMRTTIRSGEIFFILCFPQVHHTNGHTETAVREDYHSLGAPIGELVVKTVSFCFDALSSE
jgi:hypothetical protein